MQNKQLNKVNFDIIRYSNCWEDADVLLEGLKPHPNGRILSIGSAGDNSFSLLTTDPELVVAVDISEVQLLLIELKKAAIENLDYHDFLCFLGFHHSSHRVKTFNFIKSTISSEAKIFWEQNISSIETGIIYMGKFEKYFSIFYKIIMPLIHNKKTVEKLFAKKSEKGQGRFYSEKWNNRRWRWLFSVFFSKAIMGRFGRDPEFLKQVNVPVSEYIFLKAEKHLKSTEAQNNYFLKFILTGEFGEQLPHYARPEHFEAIKKNIDKLQLFHGTAEKALEKYPNINYMNLSNIFEYMDSPTFKNVGQSLLEKSAPDMRMAYWNLMVPRHIKNVFPNCLSKINSDDLAAKDKGFFYSQFIVNKKQHVESIIDNTLGVVSNKI